MPDLVDRHIRHDWKTFNDTHHNTKTVRAVCGTKTRPELAGIPGVTAQREIVVDKGGKLRFGWCPKCCADARPVYLSGAPLVVVRLHENFWTIVSPIADAVRK